MKPTLKEIARISRVSAMTVSRVISGKTEGKVSTELAEKIRQNAVKLGYCENRLAKAMRTGVIPLIALCIHEDPEGRAPNLYWFDLLGSAKRTFAAENVQVLFVTYSDVDELAERIKSLNNANMIGGVISNLDIPGKNDEICRILKESGLPCVVFGDPGEEQNIPYSVVNSDEMVAGMLDFLRPLGAKDLKWFNRNTPLPCAEDAADGSIFYQVSSELLRTSLIELAGIPAERIVIVSHYVNDLGGHQGFVVKSHTEERCRHALRAIQQQTRKEAVSEFSKIIKLSGADLIWIDKISKKEVAF